MLVYAGNEAAGNGGALVFTTAAVSGSADGTIKDASFMGNKARVRCVSSVRCFHLVS